MLTDTEKKDDRAQSSQDATGGQPTYTIVQKDEPSSDLRVQIGPHFKPEDHGLHMDAYPY